MGNLANEVLQKLKEEKKSNEIARQEKISRYRNHTPTTEDVDDAIKELQNVTGELTERENEILEKSIEGKSKLEIPPGLITEICDMYLKHIVGY